MDKERIVRVRDAEYASMNVLPGQSGWKMTLRL